MDVNVFSKRFYVRKLDENDVDIIYNMSCGNHIFYKYHPPFVSRESILKDMTMLPQEKSYDDKFYIGYFENGELIGIMDLIFNYPAEKIAYIGLFMIDIKYQNQGIGSEIISEFVKYLTSLGYQKIKIGVDKGNPQSYSFWLKNKFKPISENEYILMELEI